MKTDDKKYQIALTLVEGVGDVIGKKLLSNLGSAKAIFFTTKEQLLKIDGIGKILIETILNTDVLVRAEKELKWIEKNNIQHLFFGALVSFSNKVIAG